VIEPNREQLMQALEQTPDAHEYERKLFFAVLDADGRMLLNSRKKPEIPGEVVGRFFRIQLHRREQGPSDAQNPGGYENRHPAPDWVCR